MERNCIKSVVSFSASGQRGCSEALTKQLVNPGSDGELEMCAVGGKHAAVVILLERAAQGLAGKGRGFAAAFG